MALIARLKSSKVVWWAGTLIVLGVYFFAARPVPLQDGDSAGRSIPINKMFHILAAENNAARGLYTKDIVGAGMKSGMKFSEKWRETDEVSGPLPALFLREAATWIQKTPIPLGFFLGSDYPIAQSNKFVGIQAERFQALRGTSKPEFFYASDTKLNTAMFPDFTVSEGCVTCHNEHPESPKVDWKLNEIMGATTWSYPKDKISFDELVKIIATYRGSVAAAYDAYLAKVAKFDNPPEIGAHWPKDGYFLPTREVFVKEFEQRASVNTINFLLQINAELGPK